MVDYDEALDFPPQESAQKGRIVAEGHTALRLTVRAMHVRMRKHAIPAKHLALVERNEPDGANSVEKLLPQHQLIHTFGGVGPPFFTLTERGSSKLLPRPECASSLSPLGK